MPRIVYLTLALIGILIGCDASEPEASETLEKKKMERRISSISVESARGNDHFQYSYPSKGITEVQAKMGTVVTAMRYEYNESDQLIEWISGNNHVKYQYGPNSTRIGFVDSRGVKVISEYDAQNRVVRENEVVGGNVTRSSFYTYKDGNMPVSVSTTANYITKTFELSFFDTKNPFRDTCELVYSYDLIHWLGYGALYGDKILKKAELKTDIDMWRYDSEPQRGPADLFNESPEFELEMLDKSLVVKKKSDNNIHWFATVEYAEFEK